MYLAPHLLPQLHVVRSLRDEFKVPCWVLGLQGKHVLPSVLAARLVSLLLSRESFRCRKPEKNKQDLIAHSPTHRSRRLRGGSFLNGTRTYRLQVCAATGLQVVYRLRVATAGLQIASQKSSKES